jgi:hypothetical protein
MQLLNSVLENSLLMLEIITGLLSRCINGLWLGGPTRMWQSTLDNEVFKNDVHKNIVCLLEKNLEV